MKVIFSRKGFDSQYGGVPNAVLPNGQMVPFPIPDGRSIVTADAIRRGGEVVGAMVEQLTRGQMSRDYAAHLDPDLDPGAYPREPGWRPVLGQTDAALGHLEKQGVGAGDLFLFFGWYRPVERKGPVWAYVQGVPPVHAIWGWLHVGSCFDHTAVPPDFRPWLAYHPHLQRSHRKRHLLYAASDFMEVGGHRLAAGGIFPRFSDRRVLSASGMNMSVWDVPGWMHPEASQVSFSYIHAPERWAHSGRGGALVKTVGKGQEIVMTPGSGAPLQDWLAGIFEDVTPG